MSRRWRVDENALWAAKKRPARRQGDGKMGFSMDGRRSAQVEARLDMSKRVSQRHSCISRPGHLEQRFRRENTIISLHQQALFLQTKPTESISRSLCESIDTRFAHDLPHLLPVLPTQNNTIQEHVPASVTYPSCRRSPATFLVVTAGFISTSRSKYKILSARDRVSPRWRLPMARRPIKNLR